MNRAKATLYLDAIAVVLWIATIVSGIASHLAYRAVAQELAAAAPAAPNAQTGEVVPLEQPGHALVYITQANTDRLTELNAVGIVCLALFGLVALVIVWRGSLPRLFASFAPWRPT